MPSLYWLKTFVSSTFYFKKPFVKRIESVDLVIEDKMLFMMSWEFAGHYKLKIPLVKKSYKARVGSVVIKIPPDTNYIYIKVKSWWRTSHYTFYLTRLKLDALTARQIIRKLKPFNELLLNIDPIHSGKYLYTVHLPTPAYTCPTLIINCQMSLQKGKLIYPHK